MKEHNHTKLKTHAPRPLFSCGFFRHCTQTTLSPTTPHPPSLPLSSTPPPPPQASTPPPLPPPPPPPHAPPVSLANKPRRPESSSSSSSSSSTSQSFTQWKFPLPNSPLHHHDHQAPDTFLPPLPPPVPSSELQDLFHSTEVQLSTGSESEQLYALHLLERSLVPNPPADPVCPLELMRGIVANLRNRACSKPATKILLALCLADGNRQVAVEAGAVGTVVEVAMELEIAAAERALAVLELTCTVDAGAAELRAHALAVPVMVTMMGKMAGRGREYAISALGVIYGGGGGESVEEMQHAPPEEVARAVELALQGECTARGRRKGSRLLKTLKEYGQEDLNQEGNQNQQPSND